MLIPDRLPSVERDTCQKCPWLCWKRIWTDLGASRDRWSGSVPSLRYDRRKSAIDGAAADCRTNSARMRLRNRQDDGQSAESYADVVRCRRLYSSCQPSWGSGCICWSL